MKQLIVLFLFVGLGAFAQDYSVTEIPAHLLEDAMVVKRSERIKLAIIDEGKANYDVHQVYTILDRKAASTANLVIYYDRFKKIEDASVTIYDADGKRVKRFDENDFKDYSAYASFNLYADNRAKVIEPEYGNFPFTVEFRYEISYKGILSYPSWYPLDESDMSIEQAEFIISTPAGIDFRSAQSGFAIEPVSSTSGKYEIQTYSVQNIAPFKREPYGPVNQSPYIRFAPIDFNLAGNKGSLESWESFSSFYHDLNADRDKLSKKTKEKVHQLVDHIRDPKEKARVIYDWMQSEMRYVSVQLGIGGWQTFEASYVEKNKYGDCKALTNYTKALLKEVGIPSYPVLVKAGNDAWVFDSEMPSNQFNHVFLMLPLETDTVWMECTSKNNPFGFKGSFWDDRNVLQIMPQGGKLLHIAGIPAEDNALLQRSEITLFADGSASSTVFERYTGSRQERFRGMHNNRSEKDQEDWLEDYFDIASYELGAFELKVEDENEFAASLDCELEIRQFASVAGDRLLFCPTLEKHKRKVPKKLTERSHDVVRYRPRSTAIETTINLPAGFSIDNISEEPVQIETKFGSYFAHVQQVEANKLSYTRKVQWEKFRLGPEHYDDLRKFIKAMNKADRNQVVIKKG